MKEVPERRNCKVEYGGRKEGGRKQDGRIKTTKGRIIIRKKVGENKGVGVMGGRKSVQEGRK